jgi:putative heme-binding domain-containing protein
MGRIWRLSGKDGNASLLTDATKKSLELLKHSGDAGGLLPALRSTNGWTRDTAFRLITEQGAKPLAKQLQEEVDGGKSPAATTAACLNLLANAGSITDDLLLAAVRHPDAAVRENAVRLAEPRLGSSSELAERVLALADDPDVHVRYAVALAAGEIRGRGASSVVGALRTLAAREADDKWFRAAILTSVPKDADLELLRSLAAGGHASEGELTLLQDVARLGARLRSAGGSRGHFMLDLPPGGFDQHAAILIGYREAGGNAASVREMHGAKETFDEAAQVAADANATPASRKRALVLLGIADGANGEAAMLSLVTPAQPTELAVAAIRALAQPQHVKAFPQLLTTERWGGYSPALRSTILASVTGRPEFAQTLVDAIESGAVPASALSEPQRKWLASAGDDALKARAAKLLAGNTSDDRKKAFEDAKAVLKLKPDPAKGQRVFMAQCSSCHRLEREGYAVGPDLYSIRSQPKESILLHIVIPEQEVAPNFAAYDCVTTDGRTITGIMTAETPSSVTLRQVLGLEETLPREKIKSLTVSKSSLMPQGLEKAMKPQELADLLAYLRGEK